MPTPPLLPESAAGALKQLIALATKLLGPGVEQTGEILADRLRLLRFQLQIRLLRKAEDIAKAEGFPRKAINGKVLFSLLHAADLEDNNDMQERWASLLASAMNANNKTDLEPSFIEILKQLTPSHAYLLDVIYEQVWREKLTPAQWAEQGCSLSELKAFLAKEVPDFEVAIDNLFRLNLIAYPTATLGVANGNEVRIHVTSGDIVCATHLGYAFIQACGHGRSFRTMSYCVPGNSISNLFWTRGGSLTLTPLPPAKAIAPGPIPPELQRQLQIDTLEIAKAIGYVDPRVVLRGRTLMLFVRNKHLPPQAIAPLGEFCAERGLQLQVHQAVG